MDRCSCGEDTMSWKDILKNQFVLNEEDTEPVLNLIENTGSGVESTAYIKFTLNSTNKKFTHPIFIQYFGGKPILELRDVKTVAGKGAGKGRALMEELFKRY